MAKTIVVTGATGQVGRAVVEALAAEGLQVKATTREPGKYRGGDNVIPVRLDYHEVDTIAPALAWADGLFLIALPLDPNAPKVLAPIIDQAKTAGVKHIVFNSALGVDKNEAAPLRIVERYLMDSGVPYTILRPNFFMENFSSGSIAPMINDRDGIFLAAGGGKTSFITTRDIAAVVAAVFDQGLVGQEFNLTGPTALDHYQVAEIIGNIIGRQITYQPLTEAGFLELLHERFVPVESARYLTALYGAVRAGLMAEVTGDVQLLTGKEPTRFTAFAEKYIDAWGMLTDLTMVYGARKSTELPETHPDR